MNSIKRLAKAHPRFTAWLVLAVAMLIVLFATTRGVALTPAQFAAVAAATVVLAGLCVWIVHWE